MKQCSKCKQWKDESEFYKRKGAKDGYRNECKECRRDRSRKTSKIYRLNNKEKVLITCKIFRDNHKEEISSYQHQYYLNNRESKLKESAEYRKDHKKEKAKYMFKRRHTNTNAHISDILRLGVNKSLRNISKSTHTIKMLGGTIIEFKQQLINDAKKRNYIDFDINHFDGKKFHIDHKVPCHLFNMKCSYHQKLCFHHSNLQLLSVEDHKEKHRHKFNMESIC